MKKYANEGETMNAMIYRTLTAGHFARTALENRLRAVKSDRGEVNVIAIVLLIVAAIAAVVIFQGEIKDLIENIFKDIDSDRKSVGSGK